MSGNSPSKIIEPGSAGKRKSLLSKEKLLGVGVSVPKPNFVKQFQTVSIEPNKSSKRKSPNASPKALNPIAEHVQFPMIKRNASILRQPKFKRRGTVFAPKLQQDLEQHLRVQVQQQLQQQSLSQHVRRPVQKILSKDKSFYSQKLEELANQGSIPISKTGLFSSVVVDEVSEDPSVDKGRGSSISIPQTRQLLSLNPVAVGRESTMSVNKDIGGHPSTYDLHNNSSAVAIVANHFTKKKGSQQNKKTESLGINNVDNSIGNCQVEVKKYWKKKKFDEDGAPEVKKTDLVDMVKSCFGLKMTQMQAAEVIVVCKIGNSSPFSRQPSPTSKSRQRQISTFDTSKLVPWLSKNLPFMYARGQFNLPSQTGEIKAEQFNNSLCQFITRNGSKLAMHSLNASPESSPTNLSRNQSGNFNTMSNRPSPLDSHGGQHFNILYPERSRSHLRAQSHVGSAVPELDDINHQKSKNLIDESCGDPYYHIKKLQKVEYEYQAKTSSEMEKTFQNIKKFPRLKQSVQNNLATQYMNRENQQAHDGWIGSKRSKEYLRDHKAKERAKEMRLINDFIMNEPQAYKATATMKMLTKGWSEQDNAWRVMSKIKSDNETRIQGLIKQNRYGNIQDH